MLMKQANYKDDIILGLHDAIVSQTGIIAGLGLTISDRKLTILTMVVAASADALSMMAANYLAARADKIPNAPMMGLTTGASYLITAAFLIVPFALFSNRMVAIAATATIAAIIIFLFNIMAKTEKHWAKSFWEMIIICAITSMVALGIGIAAEYFLGVTI